MKRVNQLVGQLTATAPAPAADAKDVKDVKQSAAAPAIATAPVHGSTYPKREAISGTATASDGM